MRLAETYNILWNKLNNAALVSENGVNGVNNGSTFVPAIWENGQRNDANNEYSTFAALLTGMNELVFDWHMNTDFDVTNGMPSDAASHVMFDLTSGITSIRFWIHSAAGLWMNYPGINVYDTTSDWLLNTWHHFMYVISRSHSFDGAKTLALYIDGIQTGSSVVPLNDYSALTPSLRWGNHNAGTGPVDGILENLKVTQAPAITAPIIADIIANKDNEAFPSGGFRMIDSGMKSNMIDNSILMN